MATVEDRSDVLYTGDLLERAALAGFELVTRTTDTGQTVWEWQRGFEPRPQFVTERVAHYWMLKWLEQQRRDPLR